MGERQPRQGRGLYPRLSPLDRLALRTAQPRRGDRDPASSFAADDARDGRRKLWRIARPSARIFPQLRDGLRRIRLHAGATQPLRPPGEAIERAGQILRFEFWVAPPAIEFVMPGLVPGIHVFLVRLKRKAWMGGAKPARTRAYTRSPPQIKKEKKILPFR